MKEPRLAVAVGVAVAALAVAGVAAAATLVVKPSSPRGWTFEDGACGGAATGSHAFVAGPAAPPAGSGSLRLESGSNPNAFQAARNGRLDGTRLADLTVLSFSTYVTRFGPSGGQAPYLNLLVDTDGNATIDDQLVFQPINNGAVLLNAWQTWNALTGNWWAQSGAGGATQGSPKQLSAYLAARPNARLVRDGLRIGAGCDGTSWAGFVGHADRLTVGVAGDTTTFDFERGDTPADRDDEDARPAKKDREGKTAVCHKGKKTLFVSKRALRAHLRHGDTKGACRHGDDRKRERKEHRDDDADDDEDDD